MSYLLPSLRKSLFAAAIGASTAAMPVYAGERLTLWGANDLEYYYDVASKAGSRDIAAIKLTGKVPLGHGFGTTVSFMIDDNGATLREIDVAKLSGRYGGIDIELGRFDAPFGRHDSGALSDSMTLEMVESREHGMRIGLVPAGGEKGFYGSAFVFNAKTAMRDGSQLIYGFDAGHRGRFGGNTEFGFSYISHMGESKGLYASTATDAVPGVAVYGKTLLGDVLLIGTYAVATNAFTGAHPHAGTRPGAMSLELDYKIRILDQDATVAVAHQNTDDAATTGLPRSRLLASVSTAYQQGVTWGLEYTMDRAYSGAYSGTLTLRLAVLDL